MQRSITLKGLLCIAALGICATPANAQAQNYPSRPITVIVPFPAGGPSDVVARIVTEQMGKLLGQSLIIENIGGAGGATGALRVAKAAPDGYTFLLGNSGTHTYSQLLTKKPPYDAVADFTPVAVVVENSKLLITRKDFPADSLPTFIAYAKANQQKLQFGSAGIGSATHMTCVLLNAAIGVEITHVPYRGTAPLMNDVLGGQVQVNFATVPSSIGYIRAGTLRALAVTTATR
jgi:tripartite-type tricarboxylate transporter receptor subunit TctC